MVLYIYGIIYLWYYIFMALYIYGIINININLVKYSLH